MFLMRERFVLDKKENILFINFDGLKIESREQVDEFAQIVFGAYKTQGRRIYGIVNYEGTEIVPDVVDYYGETIKELQDRYAITTVRYSSSGLTRSMLRYFGAAKDLESNIFTNRDEAIGAIQEMESRKRDASSASAAVLLDPRRSLLGKLALGWAALIILLFVVSFFGGATTNQDLRSILTSARLTALALLVAGAATSAILFFAVVKPLRRMEEVASSLAAGGGYDALQWQADDEVGRLARSLNEAAATLRRDIDRLSGLYHISLMMGTGTGFSKICELLTRKIARLLDAEMCVILLCDESEKSIYAQPPAYGASDEHLRQLHTGLEEKSIATWVFKNGEPYVTNDAAADAIISSEAAGLLGIRNMLAVPLQAGDRTLGTLEVMNKEGGFIEADKRLVTIFASQAAQLLANAQLFEQVRASEERYRQIFESALDGLYRSTTEGVLITVNPSFAAMLGYAESNELVGRNLFDDLFVDGSAAVALRRRLDERGWALDVESDLRRRTGEPLPARVSIRVVTGKSDDKPYHLGIVKDITEQKRLSGQLIISERLAVVGELIAGVAHEVRNPLFGITTTLSALARRLEDREAVRPFLDVVQTEVDHLNHLMEQLLEHGRPIKLDGGVADIRSVIEEVIGEFRTQAREKEIEVMAQFGEALPGVELDRRKIHGVFANLLENALQHTSSGGRVHALVGALSGSPSNGRSELRIEFSDTGSGIVRENLSKVFEPFFTTRPAGTGLGLAIVRKTIHDHGGTIEVRSEPGTGTTFTISLPVNGE